MSLSKRISVQVKWKQCILILNNISHKDRTWDELNTELWKIKCIINRRNVIECFCEPRGGKYFKIFHSKTTEQKVVKFYFIWLISFAKWVILQTKVIGRLQNGKKYLQYLKQGRIIWNQFISTNKSKKNQFQVGK